MHMRSRESICVIFSLMNIGLLAIVPLSGWAVPHRLLLCPLLLLHPLRHILDRPSIYVHSLVMGVSNQLFFLSLISKHWPS